MEQAIQVATEVWPQTLRARPGMAEGHREGVDRPGQQLGVGWCLLPAPLGQCSSHTDQPHRLLPCRLCGPPAPPQVLARGGESGGLWENVLTDRMLVSEASHTDPPTSSPRVSEEGGQEGATQGVGSGTPVPPRLASSASAAPGTTEPAPSSIQSQVTWGPPGRVGRSPSQKPAGGTGVRSEGLEPNADPASAAQVQAVPG